MGKFRLPNVNFFKNFENQKNLSVHPLFLNPPYEKFHLHAKNYEIFFITHLDLKIFHSSVQNKTDLHQIVI